MNTIVAKNIIVRNEERQKGTSSQITTGLVVQGGGMRGIYTMAALMAIEEAGLGAAFDHAIGASAGAINCAYLLAGQAKLAATIYLDDISNKNFVNFLRIGKIVNIDFLVDEVLKKRKALDVARVKSSSSILHVVLTDYLTAKTTVVTNKDKNLDLMEAMRATAAMPILYNRVVRINGKGYIDGGVTDAVPLLRAIKLGCTDILVILTREPTFRRRRPSLGVRLIESVFLAKYPEVTRRQVLAEDNLFNKTMEVIEDPSIVGQTVRIGVVYPSDMRRMVSRTTHNRSKLLDCALMARDDTRAFFGFPPLNDNPFATRAEPSGQV